MQKRWMRIAAWALLPLAAIVYCGRAMPQQNAPSPVVRIGETQKICQLTGDVDWETGLPTAARTLTNFGLDAADLGYPVEHNGNLVLLFGDSWPAPHGLGPLADTIPDDSVGVTTRTELPDAETCIDLKIHSSTGGGKRRFDPPTIVGPVRVKQGFFNVPSGGVAVQGSLYGFFWTDHCIRPNDYKAAPDQPLERPAPTAQCPETNASNSLGTGVMARSNDEGYTFTDVKPMPEGFVYATAVNANMQADLPPEQKLGAFIFGVPRYRRGVPYLAYAPVETFADPQTWRFFAGLTPDGKPKWVSRAEWRPGSANQIYTPAVDGQYNVGEFSVTWNAPLHMWLMMYDAVAVRVAPAPWGPWSEPTVILGPADHPGCWLTMTVEGCGNRRDYWPGKRRGNLFQPGGFYGTYVLNRYTRRGSEPNSATIFWTLSTWNPYEVSIMRTTIGLTEALPITGPRINSPMSNPVLRNPQAPKP